MSLLDDVLADLGAEGDALEAMVADLDSEGWRTQTPAEGWDVATQVVHLAWTDEVAVVAATDKEAWDALVLRALGDPEGFVDAEARAGALAAPPSEILQRWRSARPALQQALRDYPEGQRMPWFGPPDRARPRWPPHGSWRPGHTRSTSPRHWATRTSRPTASGTLRTSASAPATTHSACTVWNRQLKKFGLSWQRRQVSCGPGDQTSPNRKFWGTRTTSACGSPSVGTVTTSTWWPLGRTPTAGSTSRRPSPAQPGQGGRRHD